MSSSSLFLAASEASKAEAAFAVADDATAHGGSLPCPLLLRPLCYDGNSDDDEANKNVTFN